MQLLKRIRQAFPEFGEQSQIVAQKYGGNRLYWLISMIWCLLRYGARPIDYVRFEFHKKSDKERNRYLTIYRYFRMLRLFGAKDNSIKGKKAEYSTYKDYIQREYIIVNTATPRNTINEFIRKHSTIIAKPVNGEQGHGIKKISDGDKNAIDELCLLIKNNEYILEELIINHPTIATINQSSLNTIRAYTLLKKDGSVSILAIMLRAGREGNHVDNWGSGGIGYNFDIDTGICVDYGRDKDNNPYIYHPGSCIQMIGFKLPNYDGLKSYIINIANVNKKAKFVGWDIAITPHGYDLVEMNCPGGHDFLQAFGQPFGDILKKELN